MNLRSEAIEQGLTSEEYDKICAAIGREPNRVELGIFAVMWSEHCCYKSSKIHLKKLPTKGSLVVLGPGENAGIIDFGDGLLVAFKIESHNHPSYIEPYQGAATGVGGILRDIFTMGARPVAVLDSLHFGEPKHEKTAFLVSGVVGGVGGYGNCMGIPNVGGEVYFDSSYNGNNLVNAMAVGVARREDLSKGIAKGAGNKVIYLGSKTGRDGIHGATMASQEFGSGNEERRPTVQVGDPFTEKKLMEATLEMIQEKLLVGIQDMGAAGIACSTFEMSARGKSGMEVNLDAVPIREAGLQPYEMFLSESQERMLLVAEASKTDRIYEIARKWEIDCVEIGVVTDTKRVVARHHGEIVVDLPVLPVTDEAPLYDRPTAKIEPNTTVIALSELPKIDFSKVIPEFLSLPNLSEKSFVFRQYDSTVGADTIVGPGSDAAVLRVKGSTKGLAMAVDSNGRYCKADPYTGTLHSVAEVARNLACVGAKAVATTDCLNFGNPEDPLVMGQIKEGIRAIGDACTFFQAPITGGNVSLYNQTGSEHINPTPTIGMVGIVTDAKKAISASFKGGRAKVALLGKPCEETIYESEFARSILKKSDLACPPLNLNEEAVLHKTLLQLIDESLLLSAHDCSSGGLIQALVESCFSGSKPPLGVRISIPEGVPTVPFLFGEYASRVVISFDSANAERVAQVVKNYGMPMLEIGETGGDLLEVTGVYKEKLEKIGQLRQKFWSEL
jgi:phosphoribosylformylglycinamidine synthase subunit PurL